MKKFISLLLCVVSLGSCFAFAGCSNSDALRVINFRPEDEEFYSQMVKDFEKDTGIKVIYESISTDGYPNLLNSRLTANKVDVWGTEAANVRSLPLRKYMLPLDDLKDENGGIIWDSFVDGEIEQAKHKGSVYVAPVASVNVLCYYNKAVFKKLPASITFANGKYPTTWNEFYKVLLGLQGLKNKGEIDDNIVFGGMESWPISMITSPCEISAVRSEDKDFYLKLVKEEKGYDFGHPYYRNFFTRLRELCGFIDPKSTGQTYNLAPSKFAVKECGLMIDGSWSYPQVIKANPNIDIGFFPMPLNDDPLKNKCVATKSGSAFAINNKSNKIDDAKKFIEYHYKKTVYQKYVDSVNSKPILKGVKLTDVKAQQMYEFDTMITMENVWMDGIQGVGMFRDIALKYISGSKSVDESIDDMNSMLTKSASTWKKKSEIGLWLERFYPQEYETFKYLPED